jgi:hypothetical protein
MDRRISSVFALRPSFNQKPGTNRDITKDMHLSKQYMRYCRPHLVCFQLLSQHRRFASFMMVYLKI